MLEGKYHQVKRMVAAAGNRVEKLHREQVGGYALPETLAEGAWRGSTKPISRCYVGNKRTFGAFIHIVCWTTTKERGNHAEFDETSFHPGGARRLRGGGLANRRIDVRDIAQTLAKHGIVTVAPDYRVYPQTIFPGFIDDAAAAVRWTHDHIREYGGDPNRTIIIVHSAGAHIAAMVATAPKYLQAQGLSKASLRGMIGLAGPYSQFTTDPHMAAIFPAALRSQAMPIDFVSGDEPPMLLAAGTADHDVDPVNSVQFAQALPAKGGSVELKSYPGLTHDSMIQAFMPAQRATSPVVANVLAFINAH